MARLTIVMYHYVRDLEGSLFPRIKGLTVERFRRQLDALESRHPIVTMEAVVRAVAEGCPLPGDSCLLTFDDGYSDHYRTVFPELRARGLSGAFFPPVRAVTDRALLDVNKIHFLLASIKDPARIVQELRTLYATYDLARVIDVTFDELWARLAHANRFDPAEVIFIKRLLQHGIPERWRVHFADKLFQTYVSRDPMAFADELYMLESEVRELVEAGMFVGGHTYSHCFLNTQSTDRQVWEIEQSIDLLARVGAPTTSWVMCYPYGAYNAETVDILTSKHCAVGLTTHVACADLSTDPPMELPRLDTNDIALRSGAEGEFVYQRW